MLALEYSALGLLAGTIGAAGALGLSWAVSRYVFESRGAPAPLLLAIGPLLTMVLVGDHRRACERRRAAEEAACARCGRSRYPGTCDGRPAAPGAALSEGRFLCAGGHRYRIAFTQRIGAGASAARASSAEDEGTGEAAHTGGTIVPMQLRRRAPARRHRLRPFDPTVTYDIVRVGGIKTSLFGGEGLFFASLTGPGRVWLQTLPFSRLADRIHAAYKGDRGEVKRDLGGMLGGLGDLIGGDR